MMRTAFFGFIWKSQLATPYSTLEPSSDCQFYFSTEGLGISLMPTRTVDPAGCKRQPGKRTRYPDQGFGDKYRYPPMPYPDAGSPIWQLTPPGPAKEAGMRMST
jgi:hypothetical protein